MAFSLVKRDREKPRRTLEEIIKRNFMALISILKVFNTLPHWSVPSNLSWNCYTGNSSKQPHRQLKASFIICATMSLLAKLRCVTIDVTGTLMAYKGELGDYYCMAAKSVGLPCPDYKRVHEGFKLAYKDMAKKYPCFGYAAKMPNIVWWKTCVRDSFVRAGYDYDEETFEKIFRRIYASFGSSAPYTVFPDSQPFLRWLRGKGLKVGIVSNAEYRYQDVILPALGLNKGSEWDFGVFSGLEGIEKPNPKIYGIALERAGNIAPEEALHIGDSMRKDYEPAKSIGMHALLLDRFKTPDAVEWRKSGAVVLPDLLAAQEWLSSQEWLPSEKSNC